jgi:hypothetical protein
VEEEGGDQKIHDAIGWGSFLNFVKDIKSFQYLLETEGHEGPAFGRKYSSKKN